MNICFLHGRKLKLCLTYGTFICTISLYGTFFSENKISTFDMYFAGTCWFTEKKIIMSLDGALQEYHEQLLPRDS